MQITFPMLRDRAHRVLARLSHHGIAVPPGSRLPRYVKELEVAAVQQYADPPDHIRRLWHRTLSEIDDFETILDSLTESPEVDRWKGKVRAALDGGVLRTDEKKDSSPRDDQFELLVAGVFRRAGYSIKIAEPDVVVDTHLGPFGIAAKRMRSRKKIESNVRDARTQVRTWTTHGIIAADVSILINPNDVDLPVTNFPAAVAWVQHHATLAAKHVAAIAGIRVGTDNIAGVIGYAAVPTWERDNRRMSYIKRWPVVALVPPSDPRRALLEEFAERLTYMEATNAA